VDVKLQKHMHGRERSVELVMATIIYVRFLCGFDCMGDLCFDWSNYIRK
jgi:hypothetical protein